MYLALHVTSWYDHRPVEQFGVASESTPRSAPLPRTSSDPNLGRRRPLTRVRRSGPRPIRSCRCQRPRNQRSGLHRRCKHRYVKRGQIWTSAAGSGYVGKPRPVVIVQDDLFDSTASVTVCAMTTDATDAPLIRLPVPGNSITGIRTQSRIMVDKLATIPRSKLGEHIGILPTEQMIQLERALVVFLGLGT